MHLVDLDAGALAAGAGRHGAADHPNLRLHGDIDVTGMMDAIASWSPAGSIGLDDLQACAEEPVRRVGPSLPGGFDVVASTCLLTQLIGSVVAAIGEAHPRFADVVQAVRSGHLRLLAHLARSGGAVVLVTDIVSSATLPGLGDVPEESLPGLLAQLARDRNFFHGVNPAALQSLVARDPTLNADLTGPDTVPPWRWEMGPRIYLTWALRWRKVR